MAGGLHAPLGPSPQPARSVIRLPAQLGGAATHDWRTVAPSQPGWRGRDAWRSLGVSQLPGEGVPEHRVEPVGEVVPRAFAGDERRVPKPGRADVFDVVTAPLKRFSERVHIPRHH